MFWQRFIFFYFLFFISYCSPAQIPPIGNWREHLPYHQAIAVLASAEKLYCATPYSLFSVDIQENSIERISKINGLSEVGISTMQYDTQETKLIIAYSNSNIDVL